MAMPRCRPAAPKTMRYAPRARVLLASAGLVLAAPAPALGALEPAGLSPAATGAEPKQEPVTQATPPPAEPAKPAASGRPPFQCFRYGEDWSALADPSKRTLPLDELKYIALDDDPKIWLSLGGESRTRYEFFNEPGFGLRGLSRDDYLLERLMLHADLHVGDHVRVFAQTVSAWQLWGETAPPATQDDRLDLQQAFADILLGDPKGDSVTLRGGRYDMAFGAYRLVQQRDSSNVHLNFDGGQAIAKLGDARITSFIARPVFQERGPFNDGWDDSQLFWGVYSTVPVAGPALNLDAYYLGLRKKGATVAGLVGTDTRHSVGVRAWSTAGAFDYDVEGVFQFGEHRGRDIRAYLLAGNLGYRFKETPWTPRIGVKANLASGDDDPTSSTLGTFVAPFPSSTYFSDARLLSPSNIYNIQPTLQVVPVTGLTLTTSWNPQWRFSTSDGIYTPGRSAIAASSVSGRYLGSCAEVKAEWTISPQIVFTASYVHFFAGGAIRSAGGTSTDFVGTWLSLRF